MNVPLWNDEGKQGSVCAARTVGPWSSENKNAVPVQGGRAASSFGGVGLVTGRVVAKKSAAGRSVRLPERCGLARFPFWVAQPFRVCGPNGAQHSKSSESCPHPCTSIISFTLALDHHFSYLKRS